jgi:hypothetical protein
MQIPDRSFALSGTARRPAPAEPLIGPDGVSHGAMADRARSMHDSEWWSRSERTRADPPFGVDMGSVPVGLGSRISGCSALFRAWVCPGASQGHARRFILC